MCIVTVPIVSVDEAKRYKPCLIVVQLGTQCGLQDGHASHSTRVRAIAARMTGSAGRVETRPDPIRGVVYTLLSGVETVPDRERLAYIVRHRYDAATDAVIAESPAVADTNISCFFK